MDVREKLIDLIIDAKRTDSETGSFTEYLANHLIAHGVTVQHGQWLHRKNGVAYCSECGVDAVEDGTNYCPNCGAKMEAKEE